MEVAFPIGGGLVILVMFKQSSPVGIGLFARFTYFLYTLRTAALIPCGRRFMAASGASAS